jgi:hypothetical protein
VVDPAAGAPKRLFPGAAAAAAGGWEVGVELPNPPKRGGFAAPAAGALPAPLDAWAPNPENPPNVPVEAGAAPPNKPDEVVDAVLPAGGFVEGVVLPVVAVPPKLKVGLVWGVEVEGADVLVLVFPKEKPRWFQDRESCQVKLNILVNL